MTQLNLRKLHIKKHPFVKYLAYFIFIMPFLLSFLLDIVHLPSVLKYTIDAAWAIAVVLLFFKRRVVFDRNLLPFLVFIGGFFLYTLIVYLFSYQSVLYFLWGFRNNFRFFFAFIIFCMLFTEEDADFCFKFLSVLFWINVAVSLFQFFVLGFEQDYLGGIFGTEKGCNGYSIAFFSIVLSRSILLFMSKKESAVSCSIKCFATLVIAAMAELKYFFVIFAIILLLAAVLTSFSWRKVLIILFSALLISFSSSILTQLFGEDMALSWDSIVDFITTSNYSSEEDLSRFTAIPTLSRTIMDGPVEKLFGLGLGNCDTSTFDMFNTPFYQTYSFLHYNWFSSALLFLETGYVGLTIYLLFFVMCFAFAYKQKKREGSNTLFCQMAMIMSVICVTLTFYNGSLRFEVAYMIYFVLALPLVNSRDMIKTPLYTRSNKKEALYTHHR